MSVMPSKTPSVPPAMKDRTCDPTVIEKGGLIVPVKPISHDWFKVTSGKTTEIHRGCFQLYSCVSFLSAAAGFGDQELICLHRQAEKIIDVETPYGER